MEQPNEKQLAALRDFAAHHGRYWKSKLRALWESDRAVPNAGLLRQVRNQFGPSWLIRFKLEKPCASSENPPAR